METQTQPSTLDGHRPFKYWDRKSPDIDGLCRTPVLRYIPSTGEWQKRHWYPDGFDISAVDLGNGQWECSSIPRYSWSECPVHWTDADRSAYAVQLMHAPALTQEDLDERDRRNRNRSVRRAQTEVRRLVKVKSLTAMLTLTYPENMVDLGQAKRHWKEFARRLRRVFPGFEYVGVWERQKRGALHAHVAVREVDRVLWYRGQLVKSFVVLRKIWQSVIGASVEPRVRFDGQRGPRGKQRDTGKLAGYLSKYIGKDIGTLQGAGNSYFASEGGVPRAMRFFAPIGVGQHAGMEGVIAIYNLLSAEIAGGTRPYWRYLPGGGALCIVNPLPVP